ncbi:hypothetical protein QAD02_010207 [Eretmocerus hayati]|uniref:Uncharacterized protein n=1 Tax=Eretmocerus hayati TaxID=131215 RepID=A0ACC2NBF7_9HYME|nr:hypothetical protein QAD02_010207 [Eretmocerus hayati]
MIKKMLLVKKNVDISSYSKLISFIKNKNVGQIRKKAKVFTKTEMDRFLTSAPDDNCLHLKVAAILGLCGATRREELYNLLVSHVIDKNTHFVITLHDTKSNKNRIFTVNEPYCQVIRKYISLRPANPKTESFFLNFKEGKCSNQAIGINSIGSFPKQIAEHLELPETDRYTGHSFRRTSTTILAGTKTSMSTVKRHRGWRNPSCVEEYIDESEEVRQEISDQIMGAVDQRSSNSSSTQPSNPKKIKLSMGQGEDVNNEGASTSGGATIIMNISFSK